MITTMDGIGDDVAAAVWIGDGNQITPIQKWGRAASLGWFYGTVTEALGWQHGDGEGKNMGLAAYGDPAKVGSRLDCFHPVFADGDLAVPHDFGQPSFVNDHGNYHWHFPEAEKIQTIAKDCGGENVAARAQQIIEQQTVSFVRHWMRKCGVNRLACGGGPFLNVKFNRHILYGVAPEEHLVDSQSRDAGLC